MVKARDVLDIPVAREAFKALLRVGGDVGIDHAEDVEVDAALLQLFQRRLHPLRCAVPGRVPAVFIVQRRRAVERHAEEKILPREEIQQLIADIISVRLQGIMDRQSLGVVALFKLNKLLKKAKPRERRLAALKGKGYFPVRVCRGAAHDVVQRRLRHTPEVGVLAVFRHVRIKAVAAAHIAQRGHGLYHYRQRRHFVSPLSLFSASPTGS